MEAKHTPGPWVWAVDKHNQPTSLRQSGSGDSVIHPQADVGDYGLSVDPWNDVSEADARLIAAAPDLLEALIEMEAEKADYMRLNKLGDPAKEHTNKRARAAIAKATSPASPGRV